ncbi:MAG: hypothetical protein IK104_07055, partial [Clostridia bacterium]|nr:hypothetical protein [Clostridia bacterium]MBR5410414.1 hypothetical protein [Clostridia bacterium]
SLRDLYAAAAHLFAKYCVAGVGYPEDIPTPAPCLSQKLHPLRCEAVFRRLFLFEQSERQGIILADIPCRTGSSGGKERRRTM